MDTQQTDLVESTSVDILVERVKTHPEEFFNKDCVVSRDAEKIFAHTKWRRITTLLLADAPEGVTDNLWLNLFKPDEVQRFRKAMYAAMRAEIDTAIVKVLVGESPDRLNPDAEEVNAQLEAMRASMQRYRAMSAQQNSCNVLGAQALGGIGNYIQGAAAQANAVATQAATLPPKKAPSLREKLYNETKGWLK